MKKDLEAKFLAAMLNMPGITEALLTDPKGVAKKLVQAAKAAAEEAAEPILATSTPEPKLQPTNTLDLEHTIDDMERRLVNQALDRAEQNMHEAAKLLGISNRSLRYRMTKLDIKMPGENEEK